MNRTRSQLLFQKALHLSPGGVHSPVRSFRSVGLEPFFVERGEGPYLYDVDGNRYVDFVGSWGPLVLGHAHPAVVEAIQTQCVKGTSYGACSEPELKLAEYITAAMPSMEMIRFVNSGTEATMSALRLARAYTERSKIIKFVGCYHGHADALLVEAGSGALTLGIPGSAGVASHVVQDTLSAQFNDLNSVELLFQQAPKQIAAVIVEPVVGNMGLILPQRGFLTGLRDLCTAHGALLIFDEVMTGFRVHLGGAQALYGVKPDLTTLGKVIGGGLPVGAYGGRRDVMSLVAPLGPMYQAGTLSGNPLAMVAGLTTLKEWMKEGVFAQTEEATTRFIEAFRGITVRSLPFQTYSAGTMFGFFFSAEPVTDHKSAMKSDGVTFRRFFSSALDRGIFFAPSPFEAGFMSAAHDEEALEYSLKRLEEVFEIL